MFDIGQNLYPELIVLQGTFVERSTVQGCKFSDFCLISENFTSKYLKIFFEISSL